MVTGGPGCLESSLIAAFYRGGSLSPVVRAYASRAPAEPRIYEGVRIVRGDRCSCSTEYRPLGTRLRTLQLN